MARTRVATVVDLITYQDLALSYSLIHVRSNILTLLPHHLQVQIEHDRLLAIRKETFLRCYDMVDFPICILVSNARLALRLITLHSGPLRKTS